MVGTVDREAPTHRRWSRPAALLGAGGPLVVMAVVLVGGLVTPGYDPVRQTHSELGAVDSPVRWLVNLGAFVLLGVILLVFAAAYRTVLRPSPWREVATVCLVVAGVGMVAVGFVPCDPGCVDVTATGRWHSALSAPGAVGVSSAMVLSGPALRRDGRFSRAWQRGSTWSGAVVLMTGPVIAAEVLAPVGGLLQRAAMGVALVWVSTVAVRLAVFAGESR
ncbi:hypothetical protein N869_15780 [Cellulomonas bogoriensis 69B4 = DSM 16987]|uniref:DUF998 domain-containing protein n=1 Tax=Cellulomonas bogoriensis 69B4 = DSM 16987 TaxID=1386082 RepID=A0A0A0BXP3_9CELL|nr:hypothetical protein N869_15780 [Cellulomonas bogoriensis 69B4 = DSM 16987]